MTYGEKSPSYTELEACQAELAQVHAAEMICPRCGEIVSSVAADEELIRQRDAARQQAEALAKACQKLIDYRDRAGAVNFQLEKADDFIRRIREALDI